MFIRIFGLFALAISLFGTQCWAQGNCSGEGGVVSCHFSPGTTGNKEGIYEFHGDGRLVVDFVTVLRPFDLIVAVDHTPDPLAPGVFPPLTVCVPYSTNGGRCVEYDFSGPSTQGGPNGVPVRGRGNDYLGLITLTLSYLNAFPVHTPAFLHAPGENNDTTEVYTENILTGYSSFPPCPPAGCGVEGDPTMVGKTPGLSSVAAFDEPGETDCFVFVSPHDGDSFHVGQEIEVEFRLFDSTACSGHLIRDKDARVSLSTHDSNGIVVFPPLRNKEEGDKFHFDYEDGVNEFDLSTEGLLPGNYTITVFSDEFSPQSVSITLN